MASTNCHKYGNQKWPQTWQADMLGKKSQRDIGLMASTYCHKYGNQNMTTNRKAWQRNTIKTCNNGPLKNVANMPTNMATRICPRKMNDRKSQKIELPQGINIKLPTSDFPICWQFGVQAC